MVSFQSVTAALLWAFNCQIGLLHLEWPRELLDSEDGKEIWDSNGTLIHRGLRVRMGIHWGTPECEKDPITRRMDYYGPMVNRAARIQSSADGGQLMASQDVITILRQLREYIESSDDHSLDELPPDTKREVAELRRIGGIEVKDVGEKKLKGLEVPEKLSLMFPKPLAGRLELFKGLRANAQVTEQKAYASEKSIDETRQLSIITLRLEALCALANTPSGPGDRTPLQGPAVGGPGPRKSLSLYVPKHPPPPNPQWGPLIRDNMTEDELVDVIGSLTTRIENCLSTLVSAAGPSRVFLSLPSSLPPSLPPRSPQLVDVCAAADSSTSNTSAASRPSWPRWSRRLASTSRCWSTR
jgi:adenylate cyclase